MGRKLAVDMLPKEYRGMVIALLGEKRLSQEDIANKVNTKAGKQVVSRMAINRFAQHLRKEKADTKPLERIATALERIADSLEKLPEKQG